MIYRVYLSNITNGYIDIDAESEQESLDKLENANFNDDFIQFSNEFIINYVNLIQ
jgi:hypothetical protein